MSGNLLVKPLSARLTRDTDFFSKMDPYVVIKLGNQTMKTQVAHSAGKTPSWQDNFTLRRLANDDILHVEVWDKDTFTADDIVGRGYLSLANLNSKETKTVKISHKGKDAGDLMLEVEFFPDTRPASNNQAPNFNSHAYFAPYIMQNAGFPYPAPNSYSPPIYPPNPGYSPPTYPQSYGYPPQQNYGQNYNAGPNYQAPPSNYGARPSGQNFGGPPPQNYGAQNYSSPPAQNNYSPQNNFPQPQNNVGGAQNNNFVPPQNNYGEPPQNNYSSPPPQGNFSGAPQNNNFGGAPQNNFPYTPPQNNNFGGSPQNDYASAPPKNNNFGVEPPKNLVSQPPQNNNFGAMPPNMNNFGLPPQNNSGGASSNNFGAGPQGQYPQQNNENNCAARLVQSQNIGAGNEFGKYPTLGGFGK